MAKGRMIDKVIVLSRKINKISEGAENLYYRIYVNTDDYGHYHADPNIIKGQIYTLRSISLDEIQVRISELAKITLIKLYNHNGEEYLEIVDFDKHQKFRKDVALQAIYPKPVTFTKRDVTDTGQHEPKRLPKLSKVKLSKEKKIYKRKVPLPKDYSLTADHILYANSKGIIENLHDIFEDFCLHHRKKGSEFVDWFAAWQTWIRKRIEFEKSKGPPLDKGIDPDNTAVEEAREELAKITPEQYAKNKARIAELAVGVTKKI